ncbi:Conjugal transfer protein TrbG/VirB9/CagX [mine drainage metagenome]|uniref:Conjugal transfer protein TrbG/VirB9/CagX n=1 Tax=mine drainage metagenome TaxID=410659 RepID=T1C2S1_9ZZZZ
MDLDHQSDRGLYSIGRQVVFMYAPDRTYTVLARPGAVTDLELAPGEKAEAMAIGDSVRWLVQRTPSDIFIKPVESGLYTSATLVTNYHRYQLLLVSVPPGSPWYQSIRWDGREFVSGSTSLLAFGSRPDPQRPGHPVSDPASSGGPGGPVLRNRAVSTNSHILQLLGQANMNYRIEGDASWKPLRVYSLDGRTYIEFPSYALSEDLPALFVRGTRDAPFSTVNYAVKGRTMLYPHLFAEAKLILGRQEVLIRTGDPRTGDPNHG